MLRIHTGFFGGVGMGEEVCGALLQCVWVCVSTQHTRISMCASYWVWGHAPPPQRIFFRSSHIASNAI